MKKNCFAKCFTRLFWKCVVLPVAQKPALVPRPLCPGAEGVVSAKKPTAQVMRGAKEKRRLQASANTWAVYLVRLWTLSMVLLPAPLILGPAFTLCGDPLWPSAMPVSPV